jgi:type IX secretion system PorP/SprF family membrane protein
MLTFNSKSTPLKNSPILIALLLIFIASAKSLAQDATFTQWENMPVYFNPALTGNFDGQLRLRTQYRNQWRSLLGDSSYKTSAISGEYKFPAGSVRKFSIGALALQDKAGSLDFTHNSMNLSTSVIQYLGSPDKSTHSIAFGVNAGLITRKIDFENAQWPGGMPDTGLNEKTNFADVSAGLLWQYSSSTHFTYNLGGAIHHLNRPNVSFSDTSVSSLNHRFNLHGHVEIPLFQTFSIIPSFLFTSQGYSEQLLFGLNNRWYPTAHNPNFVQIGFFAKTAKNYNGSEINTYVISATVEINSFMAGFSFDRFLEVESNAYEFSIGYTFRGNDSNGTTGNIGHSLPSIMP